MYKFQHLIIVVLVLLGSCGEAPTYQSRDSLGKPTILVVIGKMPDPVDRLLLVPCSESEAIGVFSYIHPNSESDVVVTSFCLSEYRAGILNTEALFFRNGEELRICVGRDDGFCDDSECQSFTIYDVCSTFAVDLDDV